METMVSTDIDKKHGDTCEDMKYLYNPANKYFPNDQCPVIKSYMD